MTSPLAGFSVLKLLPSDDFTHSLFINSYNNTIHINKKKSSDIFRIITLVSRRVDRKDVVVGSYDPKRRGIYFCYFTCSIVFPIGVYQGR